MFVDRVPKSLGPLWVCMEKSYNEKYLFFSLGVKNRTNEEISTFSFIRIVQRCFLIFLDVSKPKKKTSFFFSFAWEHTQNNPITSH